MADYAAALDQGTTSSRCMIFDHGGNVVAVEQLEHEQIYPKPGWVEHDANEVWQRCRQVMDGALGKVGGGAGSIAALGVTNQRETAVVWDRSTGEPVHNAIVWQDTRTDKICEELEKEGGQDRFRLKTGLPIATYFSGPKVRWILENVDGAREKAEAGELAFGNMDTWCIWNLTGGTDGGLHITDVSNASRTMLMDLETLAWDDELCDAIGVPKSMLPEIRPSSAVYGEVKRRRVGGVKVAGDLGDQQAATFGQTCFSVGEAKNTYGTGNFMLLNTGNEAVPVKERADHHGRLQDRRQRRGVLPGGLDRDHRRAGAVAARQPEDDPHAPGGRGSGQDGRRQRRLLHRAGVLGPVRAVLEGDARGVFAGLTRYVNSGHIARATLEATAFQSREVVRRDDGRLGRRAGVAEGRRRHGRQRDR